MRRTTSRRAFLARGLELGGASIVIGLGGPIARVLGGPPTPEASSRAPSRPTVHELRIASLRDDDGGLKAASLEESFLRVVSILGKDQFPLDALADLFPDDPPVSILVDARAGLEPTKMLAMHLASALVEMGSAPETILILDESDADLLAGGYKVEREGDGTLCHGSKPEPGYGDPIVLPGVKKPVRVSRALEDKRMRLSVVGRLFADEKRMGPFVLEAALGALDEDSHGKALADPEFGARVLASPAFAGRIQLVLGDLIDVWLGAPVSDGAAGTDGRPARIGSTRDEPGGERGSTGTKDSGTSKEATGSAGTKEFQAASRPGGSNGSGKADTSAKSNKPGKATELIWKADVVLAGLDLFAVERVGHTILSNTRLARGGTAPAEHPILAAAASLGMPGARMTSLEWRKVSV